MMIVLIPVFVIVINNVGVVVVAGIVTNAVSMCFIDNVDVIVSVICNVAVVVVYYVGNAVCYVVVDCCRCRCF